METIHVNLPQTSYPIQITSKEGDWAEVLSSIVTQNWEKGRSVIVITSPRVSRSCLPTLKRGLASRRIPLHPLLLPDGERYKNLSTVAKAYRGLIKLKADRSTLILLLGGGVLGDLGGFVASTYLRGLPFIQIPTTLVGQVDSSIGGKVGVDLPEGKNLVGLFKQPLAVISHILFLKSLPSREMLGGLGEVIKYGVIQDPLLFDLVQRRKDGILNRDPELLFEIVRRSSKIKAQIVEQDERETSGLRRILNFGHTFGHALERLTHYRRFLHGEAVAIGMVIAARISQELGICSREEAEGLREVIQSTGLPTTPPSFSKRDWIRALEVDKKSRGEMIHFVLMKRIGEVVTQPIQPQELVKLL